MKVKKGINTGDNLHRFLGERQTGGVDGEGTQSLVDALPGVAQRGRGWIVSDFRFRWCQISTQTTCTPGRHFAVSMA